MHWPDPATLPCRRPGLAVVPEPAHRGLRLYTSGFPGVQHESQRWCGFQREWAIRVGNDSHSTCRVNPNDTQAAAIKAATSA